MALKVRMHTPGCIALFERDGGHVSSEETFIPLYCAPSTTFTIAHMSTICKLTGTLLIIRCRPQKRSATSAQAALSQDF